jgi:Flp pilus assembly protein protease CpaA
VLIWYVFGIILLIISVNDFLFFRIEDEVIVSLVVLYIISCILGVSGGNFVFGLTVAIAAFTLAWSLNQHDLIGGGDVKLLFPLILFAENNLYAFFSGAATSGIVLSLVYVFFGKYVALFRKNAVATVNILRKKRKKSVFLKIALPSSDRITK